MPEEPKLYLVVKRHSDAVEIEDINCHFEWLQSDVIDI